MQPSKPTETDVVEVNGAFFEVPRTVRFLRPGVTADGEALLSDGEGGPLPRMPADKVQAPALRFRVERFGTATG